MQTFVPYDSFTKSAECLDYRRLGKQRVETLQILKSLTIPGYGWSNHPATKMWEGHVNGLCAYGIDVCKAWIAHGYNDTCLQKMVDIIEPDWSDLPAWWGDDNVHASHRANLLRKLPEHYTQFGWTEDPSLPYVWPSLVSSH